MDTLAPTTAPLWFTDVRMEILVAEDSYTLIRAQARPGNMPPLHVHLDHDEIFYVLEGRISLHLPGTTLEVGPGETAFGPRGVPHTYRVESSEDATWLVATTNGEFAGFIAETSVPADGEGYAPELLVGLDELAAAAARHSIELLGPPGTLPS